MMNFVEQLQSAAKSKLNYAKSSSISQNPILAQCISHIYELREGIDKKSDL